jgi:hypothetical protein
MPVAAPASVEPGRRKQCYASEEAYVYVYALAEALQVEYDATVAAGLVLQVDDAWITALRDRMLLRSTPRAWERRPRRGVPALLAPGPRRARLRRF